MFLGVWDTPPIIPGKRDIDGVRFLTVVTPYGSNYPKPDGPFQWTVFSFCAPVPAPETVIHQYVKPLSTKK